MAEVRVAVLGASGWMGKVHTMAYQTYPHFLGTSGGTARLVALVAHNPAADPDLAQRAPGARILADWREAVAAPDIDLIDICLPDSLHYVVAKAALIADLCIPQLRGAVAVQVFAPDSDEGNQLAAQVHPLGRRVPPQLRHLEFMQHRQADAACEVVGTKRQLAAVGERIVPELGSVLTRFVH